MSEQAQPSRTATPSYDALGLGKTPGQRNAEFVAGLRSELDPSPETDGLSRFSGRMAARMLLRLGGAAGRNALNYIKIQAIAYIEMCIERLHREDAIIVNLAPGFGPHAMRLAKRLPKAQVIEIDLPDVVQEKQSRLKQADLEIPENLRWIQADLGTIPLREVLDNQQVDLILATGLLAYFTEEECRQINIGLRDSLIPGGYWLGDLPWQAEVERNEFRMGIGWFSRMSTPLLFKPSSLEDVQSIFPGFENVKIHMINDLAQQYDIDERAGDIGIIAEAQAPNRSGDLVS